MKSVLKFFNNFTLAFFFLGLAPFRSGAVNIKLKTQAYFLPALITSTINVTVTGFSLYFNHPQTFGPINSILTFASLFTGMVLNLSAIVQCCFHPAVYRNLIHQMNKIESSFREKFAENLPASSFATRYRQKVLIIFSFAIISGVLATVVLWHFLNIDGILIGVLESIMNCFSAVAMIHAILYIDIARMYIGMLNVNIKNSPLFIYSASKIEFMKKIKLMHMDLWTFVSQINDFFSWSLLSVTINFMVNLVFDLYKIFRVLQSGRNPIWTSAGIVTLLFDAICLTMVVDSCHYCSLEVQHLVENVEQFAFWTNDDFQLYQLKHEILCQIANFPIGITASGFFRISREHLGEICATCCTYIIIFIQFFLTVE